MTIIEPETRGDHNTIAPACLTAALDYLARGYAPIALCPPDHHNMPATHDCSSPGKAPVGRWKRLQTTKNTEVELRRQWSLAPRCNVGIVLGKISGLVGIDVDGPEGTELLEELSGGDLPPTIQFTTRSSDRYRLLYALLEGHAIPTIQIKGESGGEILKFQGDGSQTAAPPSLHANGTPYRWAPGRGPDDVAVAPGPAWLQDLLAGHARAKQRKPAAARAVGEIDPAVGEEVIPQGARNATLASVGGSLWNRGLPAAGVLASLHAMNESCCSPPLAAAEVTGIGESVTRNYPPGRAPWKYAPAGGVASPHPDGAQLDLIDSTAFAAADYPVRALIRHVMVAGQPLIAGGAKKTLKTANLVDLAVSLASARCYLGFERFAVPERCRVGVFSGESGPHTLQATAKNVCRFKGLELADLAGWLRWSFALPQLSDAEQLKLLEQRIRQYELQVVLIDPLYLCLLAGSKGVEASNLYDMGPLLRLVAETCLAAGATPGLWHHSIKRPANPFEMPELEDLAMAGIAEFARQWLLFGRREKYVLGSGEHKLWLSIGGSVGFSSAWAVDIDEGVPDENFQGKHWQPRVFCQSEAVATAAASKTQKRDADDDAKFLGALDRIDPDRLGVTIRAVRDEAGLVGPKANAAVGRLADSGIVQRCDVEVVLGNGALRTFSGVRRPILAPEGTSVTSVNPGVTPGVTDDGN